MSPHTTVVECSRGSTVEPSYYIASYCTVVQYDAGGRTRDLTVLIRNENVTHPNSRFYGNKMLRENVTLEINCEGRTLNLTF